jgi:hypothetical protein
MLPVCITKGCKRRYDIIASLHANLANVLHHNMPSHGNMSYQNANNALEAQKLQRAKIAAEM